MGFDCLIQILIRTLKSLRFRRLGHVAALKLRQAKLIFKGDVLTKMYQESTLRERAFGSRNEKQTVRQSDPKSRQSDSQTRQEDSQTLRQSDPAGRLSDNQTVTPGTQTVRQADNQTRQADSQTIRQSHPARRQSDSQTLRFGSDCLTV